MIYGFGLTGTIADPMRAWNKGRERVPLPQKSFREQWKKELKNGR
jgi:hypothetical protein